MTLNSRLGVTQSLEIAPFARPHTSSMAFHTNGGPINCGPILYRF